MKLSKKMSEKLKKRLLYYMSSIAIVLTVLAIGKVTGISASVKTILADINSNKNILSENKDIIYRSNSIKTQVNITENGVIECDSIVQGVRDVDLPDGNYIFKITGKTGETNTDGEEIIETIEYPVEFINYYDNVTYLLNDGEISKEIALGDDTTDYKMLVVKYHKNLTIGKGITLTANRNDELTYKKGMFICVMGEIDNQGTITMTARGTYNQEGENVYLWKNNNNSYEYVAAVGGAGGAGQSGGRNVWLPGNVGKDGDKAKRQTGGGSSGMLSSSDGSPTTYTGSGSAGTSYSGGTGSGGADHNSYGGTLRSSNGAPNGGPGGDAASYRGSSSWTSRYAGGGAGNKGGNGKYTSSTSGANYAPYNGENGTGGLLILYSDTLNNRGIISSNGSNGGVARAHGGSSGGGSINIFTNEIPLKGKQTANGGYVSGGAKAGDGVVTTVQLLPELTYPEKEIILPLGNTHKIDANKISMSNPHILQEANINLGEISYDILDKNIATIDDSGKIISRKAGKTKVKIYEANTGITIYIYLEVVESRKIDSQQGNNFTIGLKQDGTVWGYGLNTSGQLGVGDNVNKFKPTKVEGLPNVKSISTGTSHTLALTESGSIYSWGIGTNGQLGIGNAENKNIPIKISNLQSIKKIDAYKNTSIALNSNGEVFVWGAGYTTTPNKIEFEEKIVDISGNLMLSEKGKVYNISDKREVEGLTNIAKISAGTAHNLALSIYGEVFGWGTNTYGEVGVETTGNISPISVANQIYAIKAGNQISFLQSDDGKVYVIGNNANGQLGLGTVAAVNNMQEIKLNDDSNIENITDSESMHTALIDENGYVWHSGINTYGELCTGDNVTSKIFVKTSEDIIKVNPDSKIYLEIQESIKMMPEIEVSYNLKSFAKDQDLANFKIELEEKGIIRRNGFEVKALNYGKTTGKITHIITGKEIDIQVIVVRKMDDLVKGFRDSDFKDGDYTVVVKDQEYDVELINYYDDMIYKLEDDETEKTIELGDDSDDYKTLVVKYHKNLTIGKGITLTANRNNELTYKKGMYICVLGDTYNEGVISMTARGTYNQEGENVYLWKNTDHSYEYVDAEGGAGGDAVYSAARYAYLAGNVGKDGNKAKRQTGGGSSGSLSNGDCSSPQPNSGSGSGSSGTSYSGGSGGGGVDQNSYGGVVRASHAEPNGGAGGDAASYRGSSGWASRYAGGGAGNKGGKGKLTSSTTGIDYAPYNGANGTGGLLILYTNILYNDGEITSKGSNGGLGRGVGGSSGGGSINIFANTIQRSGIQTVNGGFVSGGAKAGDGTATSIQLMPDLNYAQKEIILPLNDRYKIDKSKIKLINQNLLQTGQVELGKIEYDILDKNIAKIDNDGNITAIKEGKTKVKLKDATNNLTTYVYLEVVDQRKIDVQEGINFTVALKQNGTVWSYGLNTKGQLGTGNNEDQKEPVQVKDLTDIKSISVGKTHILALKNNGEVYSWGEGIKGQLGNGNNANSNLPVKVDGISNISKIGNYENVSIAVSKDGIVYIWGEGHSTLPMKLILPDKIADVSGRLLLTENGQVYDIVNNSIIEGLSKISKVSAGEAHNLALTIDGLLYVWGTNTYGECASETVGNVDIKVIKENIYDISAGNQISMLQSDNGDVYVLGNNTNGQLGLDNVVKISELTKIELSEDVKIERISSGRGTHSGLIDINGFVWHSGTNTNGELGINNNDAKKTFIKTGDLKLSTETDGKIYLDIGETKILPVGLGNTFNLKQDIIDNDQSNFSIEIEDNGKILVNNLTVTGKDYGKAKAKIMHNITGKEIELEIFVIKKMDDIVKGMRDIDWPDGSYTIVVKDQEYDIELINYYEDMRYSLEDGETTKVVSLGDNTTEYKTLVVKYHKNLTIDKGVTLTATNVDDLTYKKGMYVCVLGDTYNNGTISMTARGTYNHEGENVYLWKNIDDTYEYVSAEGGTGGEGHYSTRKNTWLAGNQGEDAENNIRQTGGGGSGALSNGDCSSPQPKSTSGSGSAGTSYSGGSGGGGVDHNSYGGVVIATDAGINGGAGGDAASYRGSSGWAYRYAGGGAGNIGGNGKYTYSTSASNYEPFNGENGTGGLLIIYSDTLYNAGTISSNGSNGGNGRAGGGSSGGGSINIFARIVEEYGEQTADGGISVGNLKGGKGGNGNVTVNELGHRLNYKEKEINLKISQVYQIDRSKLELLKLNKIQSEDLNLGNIEYESLNQNIVNIGQTGEIIGVSPGKTRIKITDVDNKYSTYIVVTVTKDDLVKPQVKQGNDFTVTLKANGTVWTYGKNENGQLGNGNTINSNIPVQVITNNNEDLKNIIQIEADGSNAIALSENGEVFIWGLNKYSTFSEKEVSGKIVQKENEHSENLLTATKIEELSNIVKVDCIENNFYAVDNGGNLYVWGYRYSKPTKVDTKVPIIDISKNMILGEDGLVYSLSDTYNEIPYLNSIVELSAGEDHYLLLTGEGYVYGFGKNILGQIGNGSFEETKVPYLVKTSNGYLNNVIEISAGAKASIAITSEGKAYAWGDNANKKIGLTTANIALATEIESLQTREGIDLDLVDMELAKVGVNHSSIVDKYGYVYSVGLNTNGQLGTEDNENRTVFTKIGDTKIALNFEKINVEVNSEQEFSIIQSNTFNLKTDIASNEQLDIIETNIKAVEITEIPNVDNSQIANFKDFIPNYTLKGNKIGRTNIIVQNKEKETENIWINVVDNVNKEVETNEKVASKVVTGKEFTVALKADGTVWSFGANNYGQLGLSDTINRNAPEMIEVDEKILDISAGENHTLLLGESGKVYAFGLNTNGQLGTGNTTTFKIPKKLSIENIVKVVAQENTSFAITNKGEVYAWGNGYTKNPETKALDYNVIDISQTYYLASDGIVRRLADNQQILISTNEYKLSEVSEVRDERIIEISEGTDNLLMLGESGNVFSYGKNTYGQLGDGTTISRENFISTAVQSREGLLDNVQEISAGDRYGIITTVDGNVYTFGINGNEQLGINKRIEEGGILESKYAILKEDINEIERVSAGYTHTAVYKENGAVYTWGKGSEGELGNGNHTDYYKAQVVGKEIIESNTNEIVIEKEQFFDIDSLVKYFNLFEEKQSDITYQSLDESMLIVNPETGEIMALKEGRTGVIAKEVQTGKISIIQVRILAKASKPDGMEVLIEPQVATSGNHTLMLKMDGTVWSYGVGNYGELGIGKKDIIDEPEKVKFPEETIITKIAVGTNHSLALDTNGNVWSWGRNNYYQLGNKNDENILLPTKIKELTNIKDIECGNYNSFAINEKGEVFSFGLNTNGEGGTGSYTSKIGITKSKYITDAIDIKAGKNHTLILKSTGEVFVTGSNIYNELGIDNSISRKTNIFTKVENLKNILWISAGESNNTVIDSNYNVFAWGANIYKELGTQSSEVSVGIPSKISRVNDIRYVSSGNGYNILLNSNNDVFVNGLNASGQLGNGLNINSKSFVKNNNISEVIQISSGNGYTVFLKEDGTVWACGDYTHGDENIKSKTKSNIPIQIGNSEAGLDKTQITIAENEEKEITTKNLYEFNLIKLDNKIENIVYESLNTDIAQVNNGIITGIKTGTTRVNAVYKDKKYSLLVNVVPEKNQIAPKVEAGENFASVLRADGTIWSYGYNSDGRLGIGDNLTKDVPTKTNIIATYKDIKVGKDFVIALRNDGRVWSVGNNKNGQLGNNKVKYNNKFSEIEGLTNITKIEAGDDFGIAIDDLGIVYVWGSNINGQIGNNNEGEDILKPQILQIGSQKILDLGAEKNQSVFVTAKGEVFGYGNILNGKINALENAIKAEVSNDKIIILTVDNKVYEYRNGILGLIEIPEKVIDVEASNGSILYQTVSGKTYASGNNENGQLGTGTMEYQKPPVVVNGGSENTFGIGIGKNNSYIIENSGNIYSAGYNEYGNLGNGNRDDSYEYTIVGDRNFKVSPKAKIMHVGDTEEIAVEANTFNVFSRNPDISDEFEYNTDAESVINLQGAKISAIGEGTANITIKDILRNEEITITRAVVEPEKDRIEKISVNNVDAEVDEKIDTDNLAYKVQITTNSNKAKLHITTKDNTDRISIDNGQTWSYSGVLDLDVDIIDKATNIPIIIGVQNNEGNFVVEVPYELIIEKITDDIGIKELTVTSKDENGDISTINAIPTSLTNYEVTVEADTDITLVNAIANSEFSYVSIDGLRYDLKTQNKSIEFRDDLNKEIRIGIKSEAGTETEYTLTINKKSNVLDLSNIFVNGVKATKVSDVLYEIMVDKDVDLANIIAKSESWNALIRIENEPYEIQTTSTKMKLTSQKTVITIYTKIGDTTKEFTLNIHKKQENDLDLKLDMLLVNGAIITPEKDFTTYIAYLPQAETEAQIRAIAEDKKVNVKIAEYDLELADSEKIVSIPENENTFKIKLQKDNIEQEYTVIIRKAESDANLDRVYVSKNNKDYDAKILEDGTYFVKVLPEYADIDVTAITDYAKAKVQVDNTGKYIVNKDTQTVLLNDNITKVKIKVKSEDDANEQEYDLIIEKMSNNTKLEKIVVDGIEAELKDDGNYHYTIVEATDSIQVTAIAEAINSMVKIENQDYAINQTSGKVYLTTRETVVKIRVKAEDGSVEDHILVVEGLSDDVSIKDVKVNNKEAVFIEGENRYEIRSEEALFNIDVILNEAQASLILESNDKKIGQDSITITKKDKETIVNVKVISQSGLVSQDYEIAILEKSNNNILDTIAVNGDIAKQNSDGKYIAKIKNSIQEINIEAIAEDEYAITQINSKSNNNYVATITENVVDGKMIYDYTIIVTAENGEKATYELEVERLEANTNIEKVLVGKEELDLSDAIIRPDGSYYYKIDRVDEAYVSVELQSAKSAVEINGVKSNTSKVNIPEEINKIELDITAEDGTQRKVDLIIEKKSSLVELLTIEGPDILKVNINDHDVMLYIDEDINIADLNIVLKNEFGQLKLNDDLEYETASIRRSINLNDYSNSDSIIITLNVKAEDGTMVDYTINIYRESDLTLKEVSVNDEYVDYDEELHRYKHKVSNGNKPKIVITSNNLKQKVQLLSENRTVLATGIGTLQTTQNLSSTDLTTKYIVKVISHNGENRGVEEYDLWITQKSKETGITYVKVDSLGTILSEDRLTYSSTVTGKDIYPIEIKLKDENAKARIEDLDGNIMIEDQKTILTGDISLEDGKLQLFKIVVTSENGEEKEYSLNIERVSSSSEIASITVTNYDEITGKLITKNVESYDEKTKTYKILLDNNILDTEIIIKTISPFADIIVDYLHEGTGAVEFNKTLVGEGITRVEIDVIAPDGSKDRKYLEIVQLSNEIGIETLEVDGHIIEANKIGDYEATVSNEFDLSTIKVVLNSETSRVSIDNKKEMFKETTVDVSKGNNRNLEIPIKVIAENGIHYTYTLNLNIVSHNANVNNVKVYNIDCIYNEDKYIAYIDIDEIKPSIKVITEEEHAIIKYKYRQKDSEGNEEEIVKFDLSELVFDVYTEDLSKNEFELKFIVEAEDGYEKEYTLKLMRKSDDNTIGEVYIEGTKLEAINDGTYYYKTSNLTPNVKVIANNEFAKVRFNGVENQNILEKEVKLDLNNKVTEIFVTITSQQGNIYDTIIYIEKLSTDTRVDWIKVNDVKTVADDSLEENYSHTSYILDTDLSANAEIKAKDENATIIRVLETGEMYEEDDGEIDEDKSSLKIKNIETVENITPIYFKIIAEDSTESDIYTLNIEKMSTDTSLKEIYVDGNLVKLNDDGVYFANVLDTVTKPIVKAVTTNDLASVRIILNPEDIHVVENEVSLSKNKETSIPITVKSQAGTTNVTYLYLNKVSTSTELEKVTINGNDCDEYDEDLGIYTFFTDNYIEEFDMDIVAKDSYATLEYNSIQNKGILRHEIELETSEKVGTFTVKSISESGNEKEYIIKLVRISDDDMIKDIFVDDTKIEVREDGNYYAATTANTAKVLVVANNRSAKIEFNGVNKLYRLEKNVALSLDEKITAIPVSITSQSGMVSNTVIYIERISEDKAVEFVKVNSMYVDKTEEQKYHAYIYDTVFSANIEIQAKENNAIIVRTNEIGDIYVDENSNIYQGKKKLTVNIYELEDLTTMYFRIVAEDGTLSDVYNLDIEKMSTDTTLKELYIDGNLIELNEHGKYIANVLDTSKEVDIKAITNHKLAHIRIALNQENIHEVQNSEELSVNRETIIPITVRSQAGTTSITNVYINKISTSTLLDMVVINNKEEDFYDKNTYTYSFLIDSKLEEFELEVFAESEFTKLKQDEEENIGVFTKILNINQDEEGKRFKLIATSESGREQEYIIELVRKSSNTNIEFVKSDGDLAEIIPDEKTFIVPIYTNKKEIELEVKAESEFAKIRLADNAVKIQKDTVKVNIDENEIIVPVVVIAPDGKTIETYSVIVKKVAQIKGKIITENIDNNFVSRVRLYDKKEIDERKIKLEAIAISEGKNAKSVTDKEIYDGLDAIFDIETKEDGTFEMNAETGVIYDLIVTKQGYLSYILTGIEAIEFGEYNIGSYKLIGGDVIESGEIQLDDMVNINNNYCTITDENREEKAIYDLNEDGKVDKLDRAIVKENYGKKSVSESWIDLFGITKMITEEARLVRRTRSRRKDEEGEEGVEIDVTEFILPITSAYTVSSDYGMRIHPTTGETKMHTGIDLVVEHHSKIVSSADGEVVFAGIEKGFGNCVEIRHEVDGETVYTFYAHLSRIDVQVGDKVLQGQTIGLEGGDPITDPNPGSSTGHHLHFEIRNTRGYQNDVNPNDYIKF